MGTKVVFEAAALADALKRAAAVAPTRGQAFTKAAGIVLQVAADEVIVKATDTVTKFATWLTPEAVTGEATAWRLPSKLFSEVIGKLPTVRTKTVELEQDGGTLRMTHGKFTRASFQMIDLDGYPDWTPFSPDDMTKTDSLAAVASAVRWATAKGTEVPFIGVHFDGDYVMATDKYRFAVMPYKLELSKPITVPPEALTSVLKSTDSTLLRTDGNQLYLMPDEFTQISTAVYGVEYPPIRRVMRRDFPHLVKVSKKTLLETIDLACTMIQGDRQPTLQLFFGRSGIAVTLANQESGLLGSVLETPGQLDFKDRVEMRFNPENLTGALEGCPNDEVMLGFDPDNSRAPLYINGAVIEFWIAPKQKVDEPADD